MPDFNGTVDFTSFAYFYDSVRENPSGFVNRVLPEVTHPNARKDQEGIFTVAGQTFSLRLAVKDGLEKLCIERKESRDARWHQQAMFWLADRLFLRSGTGAMASALGSRETMKTGILVDQSSLVKDVMEAFPLAGPENEREYRYEREPAPDPKGDRAHKGKAISADSEPILYCPREGDISISADEPCSSRSSRSRRNSLRMEGPLISERCLTHLRPLHAGEIDAWIRCGGDSHIQLRNIDRSKTRIEDDQLILTFKSEGAPIEFRFDAVPEDIERSRRDMKRLLRIATGKAAGCKYRNMAELLGRFRTATVVDEAPALLKQRVEAMAADRSVASVSRLLPVIVKEGSRAMTGLAKKAVNDAVESCMKQCRQVAATDFGQVKLAARQSKSDLVLDHMICRRPILVKQLQEVANSNLGIRRSEPLAVLERVLRNHGLRGDQTKAMHDALKAGQPLPDGVRLEPFNRKLPLYTLRRLFGMRAHEAAVVAITAPQEGTEAELRCSPVAQPALGEWAWKTVKLAKTPIDVASDIKALDQTVFDAKLGALYGGGLCDLIKKEEAELVKTFGLEPGGTPTAKGLAVREQLRGLLASVRIGNTTIGSLERWNNDALAQNQGEMDFAAPVRHGQAPEPLSPKPVWPQQAAALAIRRYLSVGPRSIANVTSQHVGKSVCLLTSSGEITVSAYKVGSGPGAQPAAKVNWLARIWHSLRSHADQAAAV